MPPPFPAYSLLLNWRVNRRELALFAIAVALLGPALYSLTALHSEKGSIVTLISDPYRLDKIYRSMEGPWSVQSRIQLATPNLAAAQNQVKEGKLRALAVTSRERSPLLPDVPSASEVIPGFENAGWFGLLAAAGTPKEAIDRIQQDSAKILLSEEFRARLREQGMTPVANKPAEFAAAIREESAHWATIIRERNIQSQ